MSTTSPATVELVSGVVAFTDVVGFTEFTALQGDDQAVILLDRHERLLRCALSTCGRVIKNLGDGFLIWFDSSLDAIRCLLDFQDLLADVDDEDESAWLLAVRIGAHFGTPLARNGDLLGHDVNVAARILDIAGPDEVLVSDALLDQVVDDLGTVQVTELGPVSMKGIPEPVRLHRVSRDR